LPAVVLIFSIGTWFGEAYRWPNFHFDETIGHYGRGGPLD